MTVAPLPGQRVLGRVGSMLVVSLAMLLLLPAVGRAQNPPVVYVHGVTENACDQKNMAAVLEAIGQRLPEEDLAAQEGPPCPDVAGGQNPLRFRYVADKEGALDGDKANGGSSQSGARRNATALRDYIDRLTQRGRRKVMLVGFSMGGLIIRTYLSDHPEHADARVAGVVFLESALQGSYAGLLAKGANSSEALDRCAAGLDVPIAGRRICSTMLGLIRQKLELANEDAIAFRDLSPGSEIVRANAGAEPPGKPRYLNLPGDIRLKLPLTLGAATYPGAGSEIPIGDVLIPRGNPDPSAVPALGGAGFEPVDLDARTIPLTRRCGVGAKALQSLAEATLEGDPETAMPLKCFDPPEAHWNVNADAAEIRPRRGTPLPTLVADFLVETCKAEHLGRCAPEPLIGSGGRCGVLETGESWRGLFQGPRRPINLEVKVLDGAPVTCSEARKILLWYTKAYNPCVDAGNTCRLERPDLPGQRGGWACSAPTAGSYPLMYRCDSSEQGTSVGGFDAVGPARLPTITNCGNPPGVDIPGPFDVKANIGCEEAMAIAEQWIGLARGNEDCFDERCKVYGFGCTSRNTGYESAETRCTWGSREVRFEHGS